MSLAGYISRAPNTPHGIAGLEKECATHSVGRKATARSPMPLLLAWMVDMPVSQPRHHTDLQLVVVELAIAVRIEQLEGFAYLLCGVPTAPAVTCCTCALDGKTCLFLHSYSSTSSTPSNRATCGPLARPAVRIMKRLERSLSQVVGRTSARCSSVSSRLRRTCACARNAPPPCAPSAPKSPRPRASDMIVTYVKGWCTFFFQSGFCSLKTINRKYYL